MWQSVKVLKVFNTLTLKQIFENLNLFLKKLEYPFLVENTKIENASFPCKIVISEANVKTIECWLQNGPIGKSEALRVTILIFWKFCFSLRTSYKELIWCINDLNAHIPIFCKHCSFIWRCFFLVSILNIEKVHWGNYIIFTQSLFCFSFFLLTVSRVRNY